MKSTEAKTETKAEPTRKNTKGGKRASRSKSGAAKGSNNIDDREAATDKDTEMSIALEQENKIISSREEVRVTRYDPINPGPYPEDHPPRNKVRFTPVQLEAIRSGVNEVCLSIHHRCLAFHYFQYKYICIYIYVLCIVLY